MNIWTCIEMLSHMFVRMHGHLGPSAAGGMCSCVNVSDRCFNNMIGPLAASNSA